MKKEKVIIQYPEEKIIKLQVEQIVEKGLPARKSFYAYLKDMYQQVGLKYLFYDFTEVIFIMLILGGILTAAAYHYTSHLGEINLYPVVFILSPIIYLAIALLFLLNMKKNSTYEIEMTCRYNLYQLAAFRMLVFSLITIAANGLLLYCLTLFHQGINYMMAFAISMSALFLFSTIFLYGMMTYSAKYSKYFIILGWVMVNVFPIYRGMDQYHQFLTRVPVYLYWGITIVCFTLYVKNLKKLISFRSIGGTI